MAYGIRHYTAHESCEFRKFFHAELREYWTRLGFDILKFDDDIVKSGTMSIRQAIFQTYGNEAVKLIQGFVYNPK